MYELVADLPLTVETCELSRCEADTSSGFTRVTTVVELRGEGAVGRGEDVTYDTPDQEALLDTGAPPLAGEYRFDEFSAALDDAKLFPAPPERPASRQYRRWAFESAALDLALRQAGESLGAALGRSYDPVRFVVSTRLGDPPTAERVRRWSDIDDHEFKLDPTAAWTDDLVAELSAYPVRVVDLKGYYEGTDVDQEADPALYERVASGFPDAIIEDPGLTEATRPAFEGEEGRVAWDYPITSAEDVRERPFGDWINVKPSRFGRVETLLDAIAACESAGVGMYGGGQFELGPGRHQIQALASLFYPDGPNDVAPGGFNAPEPREGLPTSPLAVRGPEGGIATLPVADS
jgi:hypothetical protein